MHEIHFYRDRNGKEPVLEYLRELSRKKDKEGNGYISVVLKAVGGESLYLQMNKLLEYIK